MMLHIGTIAYFSIIFVTVCGVPLPANDEEVDLLQVPLQNGKELDILTVGTSEDLTDRNKRTIGLLRELFPDITKQGDGTIDLAALNKQLEETIRVARQASEAESLAQQQQQQQPQPQQPQKEPIISNEVQQAPQNNDTTSDRKPTEPKAPAIDDLSLDSSEDQLDDEDRNKRFLPFGGSSGGIAGGGGAAGGGSGNFLFDIVRLFSGSVQTQTGDEANNDVGSDTTDGGASASADSDADRAADGYTEGIPGPVTRFVVLANRGLASLIQDLILRIAATSERLVNFKAKLITALI